MMPSAIPQIIWCDTMLRQVPRPRIEQRADAPTTPQFNRAAELLNGLKKGRAA